MFGEKILGLKAMIFVSGYHFGLEGFVTSQLYNCLVFIRDN